MSFFAIYEAQNADNATYLINSLKVKASAKTFISDTDTSSKFQIFNGGDGEEGRTTSPRQISLKSAKTRRDIAIYRFFKMAAAAILDFKNFKF